MSVNNVECKWQTILDLFTLFKWKCKPLERMLSELVWNNSLGSVTTCLTESCWMNSFCRNFNKDNVGAPCHHEVLGLSLWAISYLLRLLWHNEILPVKILTSTCWKWIQLTCCSTYHRLSFGASLCVCQYHSKQIKLPNNALYYKASALNSKPTQTMATINYFNGGNYSQPHILNATNGHEYVNYRLVTLHSRW